MEEAKEASTSGAPAAPLQWFKGDPHYGPIENADPCRLRAALQQRLPLGFSFSGGGFLIPYHVGALKALLKLGLVRPGVTHVGGSSAGSIDKMPLRFKEYARQHISIAPCMFRKWLYSDSETMQ
jgi:hypothetical protein